MRLLFVIVLVLVEFSAFAQEYSSLKHVDLDELVYSSGKPKSKNYKVKIDHVTQHFIPPDQGGYRDTFGYLTHFPALSDKAATIYEVDCRLARYDTSEISIFLIILQTQGGDTVINRVSLDQDVIRHGRTTHHFASADAITIDQGDFYMGYVYFTKAREPIDMRLYCSMRRGSGAALKLKAGEIRFFPGENFPFIFPFGVRYY